METQTHKTLSQVELEHVLDVLEKCGWNRTRAAHHLDISIRTLRNKIQHLTKDGKFVEPSNWAPVANNERPRKEIETIAMVCCYCQAEFRRNRYYVAAMQRSGQTRFYCCKEHFHNHKSEQIAVSGMKL